ncbi:glutamate racemase [Marinobacter orientalis]|uniref:Glutamate racemase n=1 Tax=Marinobacter orientalis TaxID=1928859 RepID=A0A7Y0RDE4_9GAMM|nr:glutamate racemase [Marinobacter orientalis]NMT64184.1 glutamate racemase [Marinobacter orientalis]TGX49410.1 glutamate racemase [Marinobacter orientalis]
MTTPRVLVFDSGVGGLSIAACIHQQLPAVKLVYLADNAAFPYGNKAESVVVERSQALIAAALGEFPCDVIVVACNTASTVVLPYLRAMTSIPVIGVVPAVKPAVVLSVNRRIGVLATPATVRRPYLVDLISEFADGCKVERLGHPDLVYWIERLVTGIPIPGESLSGALQPFRDAGVDTVVLGCTHYPLITELLRAQLPGVKYWVDSGDAIARRTAWLLEQQGSPADSLKRPIDHRPVEVALFTGAAPRGLGAFLSRLGLGDAKIRGGWPAAVESIAAAGAV